VRNSAHAGLVYTHILATPGWYQRPINGGNTAYTSQSFNDFCLQCLETAFCERVAAHLSTLNNLSAWALNINQQ
jgi:hypothetical protein